MNEYTLYTYYSEAAKGQVTSAIHWRDARQFRLDHPDAVPKK